MYCEIKKIKKINKLAKNITKTFFFIKISIKNIKNIFIILFNKLAKKYCKMYFY